MMAAFDDVDGVDLHIAEMGDRIGHGLRPIAERRRYIEPLRAQPDAAASRLVKGWRLAARDMARQSSRIRTVGAIWQESRAGQSSAALIASPGGLTRHRGLLRLHIVHAGGLHLAGAHVRVGHGHFLVAAVWRAHHRGGLHHIVPVQAIRRPKPA